jgi:hypothetical protein
MLMCRINLYNVIHLLFCMISLSFHKLSVLGDGYNNDNIGYSVDDFYADNNKYSFFFPKSIPIYNVRRYNHSGNYPSIHMYVRV